VTKRKKKVNPKLRLDLTKIKKWSIRLLVFFFGSTILVAILYAFIPVWFTPLMLWRSCENLFDGKSVSWKHEWRPIEDISPNLQLAVVCAEDQKFEDHVGFDFDAIEKAMQTNNIRVKKGLPIRGASTISQQCAKNVFLFPSRLWIRKGFEVYFTVLIETLWSKERILEVYLNVIEMGPGIYGAEAASKYYYKKTAEKLSLNESASLAAILPNPRKYSPTKPTAYISRRKSWIIRQMHNFGALELTEGK